MGRVLAVVGMHRSGTSLTAKWLAHSGLHVGDELIVRATDNPTGHYEDRAFVALHVQTLKANGLDHLVTGDAPIVISEDHRAQAERLIAERLDHAAWGWKFAWQSRAFP